MLPGDVPGREKRSAQPTTAWVSGSSRWSSTMIIDYSKPEEVILEGPSAQHDLITSLSHEETTLLAHWLIGYSRISPDGLVYFFNTIVEPIRAMRDAREGQEATAWDAAQEDPRQTTFL